MSGLFTCLSPGHTLSHTHTTMTHCRELSCTVSACWALSTPWDNYPPRLAAPCPLLLLWGKRHTNAGRMWGRSLTFTKTWTYSYYFCLSSLSHTHTHEDTHTHTHTHTHRVYKKRESRYNFSQSGSSAIHPVVMSETNIQSWTMASLSVSVCFSTSSSSNSAADICTKSHCGHQPAHKYSHKCEARSARLLVCDIHGCWNVQPTEWQWKCVCFCACACVCIRTHGQLCVYVLKQSACDERHKEKHTSLTPCL